MLTRCGYTGCEQIVDNPSAMTHSWMKIFIERGNVKSAWWFCSPICAARMLARIISQMGELDY